LVIAGGYLAEPCTHGRDRLVTAALQLRFDCLELGHQPFLGRLTPYDERSILPALPTIVCEAQKCEGFRFSLLDFGRRTARTRSAASSPCATPGRTSPGAPGILSGIAPPPLGSRSPPPGEYARGSLTPSLSQNSAGTPTIAILSFGSLIHVPTWN